MRGFAYALVYDEHERQLTLLTLLYRSGIVIVLSRLMRPKYSFSTFTSSLLSTLRLIPGTLR